MVKKIKIKICRKSRGMLKIKDVQHLTVMSRVDTYPILYTNVIFLAFYVSNQITLTLDFLSTDLMSPKISDEGLSRVDAMISPSFQSESQLGHLLP